MVTVRTELDDRPGSYIYHPGSFHSAVTRKFGGQPELLFESAAGTSQYIASLDPVLFYLMVRIDQYKASDTLQLPLRVPGEIDPEQTHSMAFSESLAEDEIRVLIGDLLISDIMTTPHDRVFPNSLAFFSKEAKSKIGFLSQYFGSNRKKTSTDLIGEEIGDFCARAPSVDLLQFVQNMWWDSMGLYTREGVTRKGEVIRFNERSDGKIDIILPPTSTDARHIKNIDLNAAGSYRIATSESFAPQFTLFGGLQRNRDELRATWYDLASRGSPFLVRKFGGSDLVVANSYNGYETGFLIELPDEFGAFGEKVQTGPSVKSISVSKALKYLNISA